MDPAASAAHCNRCGRDWDIACSMRVAHDVWLDADAIQHLTGTPRRTLQHWARAGVVAKRGKLYRLLDVTSQRLPKAEKLLEPRTLDSSKALEMEVPNCHHDR